MFISSVADVGLVTNYVPFCISSEMNDSLLTPYSTDEIKSAPFSIQLKKTPGMDGFNPIFFKIIEI